jgi:hypothetical protein
MPEGESNRHGRDGVEGQVSGSVDLRADGVSLLKPLMSTTREMVMVW